MSGAVMGLIASLRAAAAPPPTSGKKCTSGDLALGCCLSVGGCAPSGVGSGLTCSPIDAENSTWTYNC